MIGGDVRLEGVGKDGLMFVGVGKLLAESPGCDEDR